MSSGELKYHFCYRVSDGNDLHQGDILHKTDAIKEILKEVHPHYLDESYTGFIILSQTCDLVRRGDKGCKTRYITLGVVRPLSLLIEREIEKYQDEIDKAAMACKNSVKPNLTEFLQRLFNNNEHEYFYIEPQPEVGISEPSCAFLRLSISIRAYQHYDTCFKSRVMSLSEGFRAKLGWMIGNVYSRVGTEDWVPKTLKKKEFDKKIKDILESSTQWIDDEQLKFAKAELFSENNIIIDSLCLLFKEYINLLSHDNFLPFKVSTQLGFTSLIEEYINFFSPLDFESSSEELFRLLISKSKPKTKKEHLIEKIEEILKSSFPEIEDIKLRKICNRISNDQVISRYFK